MMTIGHVKDALYMYNVKSSSYLVISQRIIKENEKSIANLEKSELEKWN